MTEALYNVAKKKVNGENANPLMLDGQKFVPSLTRVFSKGHSMHLYFQPYEQGAPAVQPSSRSSAFIADKTKYSKHSRSRRQMYGTTM